MKRFIARVTLEFVIIVAAAVSAALLVKSGHTALGLWIITGYGIFNLWRIGTEKINAEYYKNTKEAYLHRLEFALAAAACETLWVSDVVETERLVTYTIDVPGHGRFLVNFPKTNATDAAPAAKG